MPERVVILQRAWIDPKNRINEIDPAGEHMDWLAQRFGLRDRGPKAIFKMDALHVRKVKAGWVRIGRVHIFRTVLYIEAYNADRLLEVLNHIPAIYKTVDEVSVTLWRKHFVVGNLEHDINALNREVMRIATQAMLENPQVNLRVRGRVQGVGFRNATQTLGTEMGLVGEVRNLKDGRVETIAQGTREELGRFVERVREGASSSADVTSVDEPLYTNEDRVFDEFSYEDDRDYGKDDA